MEKKKLTLDELALDSFVTDLKNNQKETVMGAAWYLSIYPFSVIVPDNPKTGNDPGTCAPCEPTYNINCATIGRIRKC